MTSGLDKVLANAQAETRQQLEHAIQEQKKTGKGLMDILRADLDKDMFGRIWSFMHKPAETASGKGEKMVKDVLVEGGWINDEEWGEAGEGGEAYGDEFGSVLVESGYVTEEQLQETMALQEKSGQPFWRILVNRGLVTPKQIADARKYGVHKAPATLQEEALKRVLLRTGLIGEDQITKAIAAKKRTGGDILQALVDAGVAGKAQLGEGIAEELDMPYIDLSVARPDPEAVKLLPRHLADQHRVIAVSRADNEIRLAMADPQDVAARELFKMMLNLDVAPALAFEKDILAAIEEAYVTAPPKPAVEAEAGTAIDKLKARLRGASAMDQGVVSMVESAGTINLVASIIEGAINSRATDIHLEPQPDTLRVRYRIDGMLYDIMNLSAHLQEGIQSRVKVLAGMDITERRKPQDGHFSIEANNVAYDLRVATLPTVLGEKMVLRLLNPESVFQGLRQLGFDADQLSGLENALAQPYGMILVTGPIGSGKTTTLYACLSQVDILTQNVVTIEDPVEYQLPGINQVQIDPRIDRSFANMLRAVIRQDANVMMVGEIRDGDTANVAVRAAMTGHLVFSTLHTNDAAQAVVALGHLGVAPFLIPNALICIVAQRLVRRLCPACRETYKPKKAELAAIGLTAAKARPMTFYKAVGCEKCMHAGYKGRTGIFEVLPIGEAFKVAIINGSTHADLLALAKQEGMSTLMEGGVEKIGAGITTIDEVLRVTTV